MLELEDLPLEVIEHIAYQLDPSGLRSFRLTSKRYENASFKALVHVIQELRFAIAPWSLPTLLDIATHPTIGKEIHTIRLARCLLDRNNWEEEASAAVYRRRQKERDGEDPAYDYDDYPDEETEEELGKGEDTFLYYFESQREFMKDGASAMLSKILSLLPNLRFVALGEWEVSAENIGNDYFNYHEHDQHIQTRISGFPTAAATKFDGAYGCSDEGFKEINIVLQALSDSKTSIEGFICRTCSLYDQFIDLDRVLQITPPLRDGLAVAFKYLRTLHLSLGQDDMYGSDPFLDEDPGDEAYHGKGHTWLASLLDLTPFLEDLTLSFFECDEGTTVFEEFFNQVYNFPHLKNFELHFLYVNANDLADFLAAHASTLETVKLRYVGLQDCHWSDFLREFFEVVTDFHATMTLARLNEVDLNDLDSDWQGSVLFDADGLSECCNFGSDSWARMRGKDCKHICKAIQRKDIEDLKITVIDREDPLYKEEEERRKQLFADAMRRSRERGGAASDDESGDEDEE